MTYPNLYDNIPLSKQEWLDIHEVNVNEIVDIIVFRIMDYLRKHNAKHIVCKMHNKMVGKHTDFEIYFREEILRDMLTHYIYRTSTNTYKDSTI